MDQVMEFEAPSQEGSDHHRGHEPDEIFYDALDALDAPQIATLSHPLSMEDILDKILPYFEDKKNLCSFRQVSKAWNKSTARLVKKNLIWKIGSSSGSESEFMKVMSNCNEDLFQNFHWTYKKSELVEDVQPGVEKFLETYGPKIGMLKLLGADPTCIERRLKSSWLPNLEQLEIYHLSKATLEHSKRLSGILLFPKLDSLHFSTDVYPHDGVSYIWENPTGRICLDIVESCSSTLKSVRTNLAGTVSKLVTQKLPSIEKFNTTSFQNVTTRGNALAVLNATDLKNLFSNYQKLKCLHVPVKVDTLAVYEALRKSTDCLENVHICICEAMEEDDDESDVDEDDDQDVQGDDSDVDEENEIEIVADHAEDDNNNDDKPVDQTLIPEFPRLKKAILHNWKLYKNTDLFGKMPKLEVLHIALDSTTPLNSIPPPNVCPGLKSLCFSQQSINELTIIIIANTFPNLEELDLTLTSEEGLTAIFKNMNKLKSLSLNRSTITDSGITGLTKEELQYAFETRLSMDQVDVLRLKPFVGDLKGLQRFEYNGTSLTKLSLYFGISWLKELRDLTLACHLEKLEKDGIKKKGYQVHAIDVAPLIQHCKYLGRLDVSYSMEIYQEVADEVHAEDGASASACSSQSSVSKQSEETEGGRSNDGSQDGTQDTDMDTDEKADSESDSHPLCPFCSHMFLGSQITRKSIALLKKAFPFLELEYDFSIH